MDNKTLKALEGSIEKWRKIIEDGADDGGPADCPLCEIFIWGDSSCKGCPVANAVGIGGCRETPYTIWSDHQANKHDDQIHAVNCPECERIARAELKFLEGLRP